MNLDDLDKRSKVRSRIRTKRTIKTTGRVIRTTSKVVHRIGTALWDGLNSIPQDNRKPKRRHYRL